MDWVFVLKRFILVFLAVYGHDFFLDNTFPDEWFPSRPELYTILKAFALGIFFLLLSGLRPWQTDLKRVHWFVKIIVLFSSILILFLISNGSMAQWLNGSMAQWLNGSMAQWLNGSMAQWLNGFGTQSLLV